METTMHDELVAIKAKMVDPKWNTAIAGSKLYWLGCLQTLKSLSADCAPDVEEECNKIIHELLGV